ncbi:MAG: RNA polymerase factor sigma-54 [Gammaproteobacteria bacterium]
MSPTSRLVPGLAQHLALGPRLSESLRILALPGADLASLVAAALAANPLLERPESPIENLPESDFEESPTTLDWASSPAAPGADEDRFDEPMADDDLRGHLESQLALERLSERDHAAALVVIDALEEDGYLHEDNATLAAALNEFDPPVGVAEIEAAIRRVQQFEPTGIAARSVAECLLLQLEEHPPDTPALALARLLLRDHCPALARGDRAELARRIGCDGEALASASALIRALDPHPGYRIGSPSVQYLVPELLAHPGPDGWRVEINPAVTPRLFVNESYAAWLGAHRGEAGSAPLAAQLEEAQWLLHSLAQREQTLLRVGRALVARQSAFLEIGAAALAPLTRRDIAAKLGLHESTVTRAVQHKSLATPRGVIPLRNFFSATLSSLGGEDISAAAVQAQIRELIATENPTDPLSDATLARALAVRNIRVARRTIAKYREAAGLPNTRERKRAGKTNIPAHRASKLTLQGESHAEHDHRPAS